MLGNMVKVILFMNATKWIVDGFFSYFQCGELTFVLTLKEKAAAAAVKWDIFCPNKGRELHKKDHLRSVR